jgi:hypothetical protein
VAEFDNGVETILYDLQGLQYHILEAKKQGVDTNYVERVLAQMKSLSPEGVAFFEEKYL